MTQHTLRRMLGFSILASALALVGCGRDEVKVYSVSKDAPAPEHNHSHPTASNAQASSAGAVPSLEWVTPKDWEQVSPGQMRYASFRVKGADGQTADLGIFPLPGMGMGDLDNVNRWRGQVGLPEITEEERARTAQIVEVQGLKAQIYDIAGENPGSGEKTRILGAILKRDGIPWYFKMTGNDGLVAQQSEPFVEFIKSLKFTMGQPELPPSHPPIGGAAPSAAPAAADADKPQWQVPPGWQESPGGQFLTAKFNIAGPENSQASVNVSNSRGDGGGLVSNINRWRRQVGLAELPAEKITEMVTELAGANGKGSLVEITGQSPSTGKPEKIIGVVLPLGSQTWFYKLSGAEPLVTREKENFLNFVQSAKHPNA